MDFERYVAEQNFLTAKEEKMETIKKLLKRNMPIEDIADITRVSVEKVNDLIAEIKKLEKEEHS